MQTPNEKTPVEKCIDLSVYAAQMMSKFKDNAVLQALSSKMAAAGEGLKQSQDAYAIAVRAILPTRVNVKYENYVSDQRIRRTQKKAELADNKAGGTIGSAVFPGGSNSIIRLLGDSQIKAMVDLEGRLDAVKAIWPEAAAELADIKKHREQYAAALDDRRGAAQTARNLRAARDIEKGRFLVSYVGIAHQVEAEYARDKAMQDLFFDDVRSRSAAEQASGDEDVPEPDDGGSSSPAAPPAASPPT